jgi:type IV pilus assembly protein PilA
MIVVAIVATLAFLAVYGVRKYLTDSKTAEARNSLGVIAKNASAAYDREATTATILAAGTALTVGHSLCASASATVPSTASKVKGAKYQSASADWAPSADVAANAGFPCLKFTMDDPQAFVYGYTRNSAAQYTATANGDQNGDGVWSTFSITGAVRNGVLNNAPNITAVNEDE